MAIISNHKLTIEMGRYLRPYKKSEERICLICKLEMEDEYHFFTVSSTYQERRNHYVLFNNLKSEHLLKEQTKCPQMKFSCF